MLSEIVLSAVVETVLDKVVDLPEVEDRLRRWLKRDPARLAFEKALARAYTAFARQYPELTASLFNESFLAIEAAPELAKLLSRDQRPDPARLTELWAASLGGSPDAGQRAEVAKAAADLLRWLRAELKAAPVFQPVFDAQALERLPAIEAQLEQTAAELKRTREQAIRTAQGYEAVVVSSQGAMIAGQAQIDVGRDFIGRDYTVYNCYFTAEFNSLGELYDPPEAVFQRVDVAHFVGRDWLAARVDEHLDRAGPKAGVFLLEGEAGVGKTAFLAHLVHRRRYLHLFGERFRGADKLPQAIQSLAAQLAARYQVAPYARRDTIPQSLAASENFLDRLLRLAANNLTAGEKLVIVCDALDEAAAPPGGNVFGLPATLPDGVFLILSQRPVATSLRFNNVSPRRERLEAASPENRRDIETYLAAVASRPEIAGQLQARSYTPVDFVRTLLQKSGGVWMYLHYVIAEIATGQRSPLDLARLPTGLVGYYAEYWGDWREGRRGRDPDGTAWDELYAPLLTTLAAAREPVSIEQLINWAGVGANPRPVQRLLRETWAAFITEQREEGLEPRYQLYHASLRDFITGRVNRAALFSAVRYLVDDLARGVVEAHVRIVDWYGRQCRDDWPALAGQLYPRRHLVGHLAGAGQMEAMFNLTAKNGRWARARYQYDGSYAGYLLDLERTRRWVESEAGWDIGRQIRCALIESSIRSLAGNIEPKLLRQLVETGLWSPAVALDHLPQIPDESQRTRALAEITPLLPDELKGEALAAAQAIRNERERASALSGLVGHLPDELKEEALTAVQAITNEWERARALSGLAEHLPEEQWAKAAAEALAATQAITNEWGRTGALSRLAGHLPDELKGEALAAAQVITNEGERARTLSELAEHLPDELKGEALTAAQAITDEWARSSALSGLVGHLPDELKGEALTAVQTITNEWERAEVLSGLAKHLPDELKGGVLAATGEITNEWMQASILSRLVEHLPDELKGEALAVVQAITDERARSSALSDLAGYLPDELKGEALAAAQAITDEGARAEALSGLAEHLPDELKGEALAAAQAIIDEGERAEALSGLAGHLPDELKGEALAAAQAITNERTRAEALSGLAEHLPDEQRVKVVAEALAAVQPITDEREQAGVLSGLAGHLPDELKEEALAAAQAITNEWERARALSGLVKHLPDELKRGVLAATGEITNEWVRAGALSGLAGYLPDELRGEALAAAAQPITAEVARVWVSGGLAEYLPDEQRAKVVAEALAAVQMISEGVQPRTLSRLAEHLPDELKGKTLAVAQAITNEGYRAWALRELAEHLPDELKREALATAQAITDEQARAWALSGLAGYLPGELKEEALAAAQAIRSECARAEALSGLAGHLPDEQQAKIVTEALAAVQAIRSEYTRAEALSGLAEHLPDELKGEALATAQAITDEKERDKALSGLAKHLPDELKEEALAAAQAIRDEEMRAGALSRLAEHLPDEQRVKVIAEALAAVQAITHEESRAWALSGLAEHLPDELKGEALTTAQAIRDERARTEALSGLAEHLSDEEWPELLKAIALKVNYPINTFHRLVSARQAGNFSGLSEKPAVWTDTLRALSYQDRGMLLENLTALAPLIVHLGGREAIGEMVRAIRDVSGWWP